MKHKKKLYVRFVDFKKTFDSVVRVTLLHELLKKMHRRKILRFNYKYVLKYYVFL